VRKLAWISSAVIALLVAVYFVATSSAFLKAWVLPRVNAAIGAQVNAEQITLRPFSQLVLQKLRLQTTGPEPLLTADEARVRYDLLAILRGYIDVHEVSLVAPQVHIAMDAEGRSNLDALLPRPGAPAAQTAPPAKAGQLNVKNVTLKNGKARVVVRQKDGTAQSLDVENLKLTLDQLRNGASGKINLSADLKYDQTAVPSQRNGTDRAQAKFLGELDVAFDPQLRPSSVKGALRADLVKAEGAFRDLMGLAAALQVETTLNEIRQLSLRFERGGKALGGIGASGSFDLEKREARLKLDVQSIDRQVLNLLGAARGWDFGDSALSATGTVELAQKGTAISAAGSILGNRFGIRQATGLTPPLDLNLDYQVNLNLEQKAATVEKLALSGKQDQRDLIQASLNRPMRLNWGAATASVPDSTLELAIRDFNLRDWQTLLGTNLPAGRVNLQWTLQTLQDGRKLSTKLAGDIQELAAQIGTNQIEQAQARFSISGQVADLSVVDLDMYRLELLRGNQVVAWNSGSLHLNLVKDEVNLKTDTEASLPELLKQFPVPDLKVSAGRIKGTTAFTQSGAKRAASGQLQLSNFTGGFGDYALKDFGTSVDFNGERTGNEVQIQRAQLTFAQSGAVGGTVDLSGRCHLTNAAAQIAFKFADVNQQLLRPFLETALGDLQLVSVALNGEGTASYDPKGASALKADLALANWAMKDANGRFPATPVNGRVQVDAALRQPEINIKQLVVDLRQGVSSAGHLDVNGKFNLTNFTGAGAFKISDFSQTVLAPVLAPALGDNKLVSIAVNGSGTAGVDPKGEAVVQAELKVSNLVVEDPQRKLPRTPLSAELQLDGSNWKQVFDVRQLALKLSPTDRAQNQVQLQGRVDLSTNNAAPSQLTLQAESLDLTPYYELFAGNAPANQPAKTQPAVPEPDEPAPVTLPVKQLTADLKIGRCYLRDVALTNVQATAKIHGQNVTLQPLRFALNGAPVSAKAVLDLGAPGFKYDVTFKADKVPLDPLASTFGGRAGSALQGILLADAQIKGAGVSAASLQKNLSGQVALSLTNLNFEIVGRKVKSLLEPIALVLRVPELTMTPLEWINAKADVGQGKINVGEFSVFSQAFYANGQGPVQLAPGLTNSALGIPVAIALRRSLAEKARLIPQGTPTNAAYVQLPTFAKLAGTLGEPKTEIDKLVISGLLLQSAGGLPKVNEKTGNLLQGLGGILSGQRPGAVNTNLPAGTNSSPAAQTNKPPKFNPLDLLELIPKKK